MNTNRIIRDIALTAMLAAVLIITQLVFSPLPNIQLTFLLLFVYSRCIGSIRTLIIILINVLVQNFIWGTLNIIYVPAMVIGYSLVPLLLNCVFKKVNNVLHLALIAILCSLLYSWCFILPSILLTEITFAAYMVGDILFEVLLAGSSFISVLWLYERLCKVLNQLQNEYLK